MSKCRSLKFIGVSFLLVGLLMIGSLGTLTAAKGPPRGGWVRWNPHPIGDWSERYNPFVPGAASQTTWVLIYEPLLYFNPLTGEVDHWLAESYQWSDDLLSVTFKLREGVKWQDGRPFAAEDVEFTFNLLKEYPEADQYGVWKKLTKVEAVDEYSVVFHLTEPDVPSLWYFGGQQTIVPKHIWKDVEEPSKWANKDPVGTGPFKLDRFTPASIFYKRNPDYWQEGKPYIEGVEIVAFKSNESANMTLMKGELDYTNNFVPNIEKTFVAKDPEHNHYWFAPWGVVILYMNTARFPFSLRPVRWAIAMAVDREELVSKAYYNYQGPAGPAGPVTISTQPKMWNSNIPKNFTHDPERAVAILESLGFERDKDGIFTTPEGKRLSFSIIVVSGWSDWVAECKLMSKQLEKIGIEVTVEPLEFAGYFSGLQKGDFDLAISWTTFGPSPYYGYKDLLHSDRYAPVGEIAKSTHWHRWTSKEVDELLDSFAKTADEEKQRGLMYRLQNIFAHELPVAPLHYGAMWYEYRTEKFVGWPDPDNPYAGAPGTDIVVNAKILSSIHLRE